MTTITLDNQTGETLNLTLHPDVSGACLNAPSNPTETTLENGQSIQLYTLNRKEKIYPNATEIADAQRRKICNFTPAENKRDASVWVKDETSPKEYKIMTFSLEESSEATHAYSKWFFQWSSMNSQTHKLTLTTIPDSTK